MNVLNNKNTFVLQTLCRRTEENTHPEKRNFSIYKSILWLRSAQRWPRPSSSDWTGGFPPPGRGNAGNVWWFFFLFQRILTDDDSVYTSSHRITFPQINESIRGAMTQLEASSQTSQTNWLSILKVTLQWIFSIFKRYFQKTCFKLFLLKWFQLFWVDGGNTGGYFGELDDDGVELLRG